MENRGKQMQKKGKQMQSKIIFAERSVKRLHYHQLLPPPPKKVIIQKYLWQSVQITFKKT